MITIEDVLKFNWNTKTNLNGFDKIAKKLGARNGNRVLEPVQKVKISRTGKILFFILDSLF